MKILPIVLAALLSVFTTPAPAKTHAHTEAFFKSLSRYCGKAFTGKLVAFDESDSKRFNQAMVMQVRSCTKNEIRIPFHVGDDHSRTWVITKTDTGLRLKHDHRHQDGSEDKLTQYGGDTVQADSKTRQEFPADDFSKQMFERDNLLPAKDNVWAIEIIKKKLFAYELKRPNRHFRVEFDLSKPVATPPAPWGFENP